MGRLPGYPNAEPLERLFRRTRIDDATGCWIWEGGVIAAGYGVLRTGHLRVGDVKQVFAHRLAYECLVGPIQQGQHVHHLCLRQRCVNPAHLSAMSPLQHARQQHGNSAAHRTHCPHGHPYDERNTYWRRTGGRMCRACKLRRKTLARARRRSAGFRAR